jgi:uncharacterized integral membrane protein
MKIANLFTSILLASWFGAIAIMASQNLTPVSLRFLMFESIKIPLGQLLAFSVGVGLLLGAIAPLFWSTTSKKGKNSRWRRSARSEYRREEAREDWENSKPQEWE